MFIKASFQLTARASGFLRPEMVGVMSLPPLPLPPLVAVVPPVPWLPLPEPVSDTRLEAVPPTSEVAPFAVPDNPPTSDPRFEVVPPTVPPISDVVLSTVPDNPPS